jgi:hypothetical protein
MNWEQMRLLQEGIDAEFLRRLAAEGRSIDDLGLVEVVNGRYRVYTEFWYGSTAEESQRKQAALWAALGAGRVPTLPAAPVRTLALAGLGTELPPAA